MNRLLLGALGALSLGMVAAPASALSIVEARCTGGVAQGAWPAGLGGCVFDGNDNVVNAVETLYNTNPPARFAQPIDLNLIGKIEAPNTTGPFGSITYDPGNKSGTWSLPGYTVDFISVKSATEFLLVKLDTPASSGSWSTLGLLTGGGTQPDLSHIQFYGTRGVIPEPATWAMLIAGFGLVGSAMRRRRETVASVRA